MNKILNNESFNDDEGHDSEVGENIRNVGIFY